MNAERTDQLVDRILSGAFDASDLDELARLSMTEPESLNRIAAQMRAAATIERGVRAAESIVSTIELPHVAAPRTTVGPRRRISIGAFSGWAAAAMIGMVWLALSLVTPNAASNVGDSQPGFTAMPAALDANQALAQYLDLGAAEGRIVEELPLVTVDLQPAVDGEGMDVLYMRRFVERTRIEGMYKMGIDDLGRAVILPADETPDHTREAL